jgi:hypothetical protein
VSFAANEEKKRRNQPEGAPPASAPRGAQSASARRQERASARDERADIASGSALAREACALKTSRRGFVASFLLFELSSWLTVSIDPRSDTSQ